MSCPGVHTGFLFGLELFKKMNSARLEFCVRNVLILLYVALMPLPLEALVTPRYPSAAAAHLVLFSPFRKKGGKSSQCTVRHIQQGSLPT